MIFQRINENKIKCTLTHAELRDMQIDVNEVVNRSDRMWDLFREVIQQAEEELDFRTDAAPLKIEVMDSREEMTLFITKDTEKTQADVLAENLSNIVSALAERQRAKNDNNENRKMQKQPKKQKRQGPARAAYVFESLSDAVRGAKSISRFFGDASSLYRDPAENRYYLWLHQTQNDAVRFAEGCLTLAEHGTEVDATSGSLAYMDEHYEMVLPQFAIRSLAEL